MLPVGFIAVLAMVVGWFVGVTIAELPSRFVPTDQPPVAISELAKTSRWHARVARSFGFVLFPIFFGGALLLVLTYRSLFPGLMEAGFFFTCFGSLACLIGLARGAFEAGLGVGSDLRDLIAPKLPIRYFFDSPEVRRRGQLRVMVCVGAIPVFFLLGGYYQAILGDLVTVVFIGYLFRAGPAHVLDAVTTLRKVRGIEGVAGMKGVFWSAGAAVMILFGLGHLALGSYLLVGYWRILVHAGS